MAPTPTAQRERVLAGINQGEAGDCWPWIGPVDRYGYGIFRWKKDGKRYQDSAHRSAYSMLIGPIPSGLQIDHCCHNRDVTCDGGKACPHRRCCNPEHLEPVTCGENIRRGRTGLAKNQWQRQKTRCKWGHEFTPANTYWRQGKWRQCRTCARDRQASWSAQG